MPKKTSFLSTNEIREIFLSYFRDHGHEIVPSSSLIPANDPTLLFTNAGMVQFKEIFLGKEERPYQRAASSQRCVRAGGKHNDLEKVGYTARHHTFFEMLGNFSFGNYFKREAIYFSWLFLTDILHIPKEKLWITVFEEDDEAANIWLKDIKIDPTRFSKCGEESNFWSMGPTGPCGPCTEIFYDHGSTIPGGPPGSADEDGDRFVEIWNLVFMQYNRAADGSMTALPKPAVDTGMGLERIAAVMQGVHNNYDIDLFRSLIKTIAKLSGTDDLTHTSLRVIADHIRSCAFLIADGVRPSNEGRGYVLRRIIRRAVRHGHQLGLTKPFFYQLVEPLAQEMGGPYPELIQLKKQIEQVIQQEEEQFSVTLTQGLKLFEQAVREIKGKVIPGEIIFKLYDTYGFPVDLTADIAREQGLAIDFEGFETAMTEQRTRSRQASKFSADYHINTTVDTPTEFVGDKNLLIEKTLDEGNIIAIYGSDKKNVDSLKQGDKGSIILDRTPFYAEAGGQIGDQGRLHLGNNIFHVNDTQKQGQSHVHIGQVKKGQFKIGDTVLAEVDAERRAATVLNHTATHLLHMVLRKVLGTHVIQKGSLVEPDRLRFDFSHNAPLSNEDIKKIEAQVNMEIRLNHEAVVKITSPEEAIKSGAMALFEEKYGNQVRMVRFGDSLELCGGTHAHQTGEIGFFKITSETGIAAGIRRLEAVTGDGALRWVDNRESESFTKLQQAENRIHRLEKEIEELKTRLASSLIQDLMSKTKEIQDIKIITATVEGIDIKAVRPTIDHIKDKLGKAVIVLAISKDGKVSVIVGVTKNLTEKIKAGELVNMIAQQIGGKGGGRPDLAEAGGNQPEHLQRALASVEDWLKEKIK